MIIYAYRCRTCGLSQDSTTRAQSLGPCPDPHCSGELKRRYQLQLAPVMQEHYNPSVDGYISSEKQLREKLKRKSDEYTEYTGIESNFQPIDPKDAVAKEPEVEVQRPRRRSNTVDTSEPIRAVLDHATGG